MHKDVEARVGKALDERVFPGCVIGVVRSNGERELLVAGKSIYGPEGRAVDEDTVYDLASITKSIPTASLALSLISEGKLRLEDEVNKYLPELKNDHGATIEYLLTYRVHGTQLSRLKDKTPDEFIAYVFSNGFDGLHGKSNYMNLPAFLLSLILERIDSESLDALAQKHFFAPLHMNKTTFFPATFPYMEIAPTEIDRQGREIRSVVHDESTRVFANVGKTVGHAGLFSTAPDLLTFLGALLSGKYQYIVAGAEKGLGWQVNDPSFMGQYAGSRVFGKTGFTGTSVVCDIKRGIAFVILSNRTYPKRPLNSRAINSFRRDIADILLSSDH